MCAHSPVSDDYAMIAIVKWHREHSALDGLELLASGFNDSMRVWIFACKVQNHKLLCVQFLLRANTAMCGQMFMLENQWVVFLIDPKQCLVSYTYCATYITFAQFVCMLAA